MKSERWCCRNLYALNNYNILGKIASIHLLLGERHYQKEQKDANGLNKGSLHEAFAKK